MNTKFSERARSSGLKAILRPFSCAIVGLLSAASAAGAVDASVTPDTLATDSAATVTVTVTGLDPGQTVLIERYADANGNGTVDAGEFLAESHVLTDGAVSSIGGVRNINVPGDEDGTADGTITYRFRPRYNAELGRLSGSQLIRVSSPSSAFAPFTRTFTLTQPVTAQTISGTIRNGDTPVPFVAVVLLTPMGDDMEFSGGAIADAEGNFILTPPPGDYVVFALQHGYVASFDDAQFISVAPSETVSEVALQLAAATTTLSGRITLSGTDEGVAGIQLFIESEDGHVVIANTGPDGTFSVPVNANVWGIEPSETSLAQLGCVRPEDDFIFADTTLGPATDVNLSVTKGNALIHGRVTDQADNPVPNLHLGASNNAGLSGDAATNETGHYAIAVTAGTWHVWFSSDDPALSGYIPPPGTSLTLQAGATVERNLVLAPVSAHISGTVTQNSEPRIGVRVGAYNQQSNTFVQSSTDASGAFTLGVAAGTWSVQLESSSAAEFNLVSPVRNITVSDGGSVTGVHLPVRSSNARLSGAVRDHNGQLVSAGNVFANITVNNTHYNVHGFIVDGHYSLAMFDGTWGVGVNVPGFPPPPETHVTLTPGSNLTRDLVVSNLPTIFTHPEPQTVQSGNQAFFSVNAHSFLPLTFQWEVSTNGLDWSDVPHAPPYSNPANATLSFNASDALDGNLYRCVVTNSAGSATSDPAELTVTPLAIPPAFFAHPFDANTVDGGAAQFNAHATGQPDPTLQWQSSTDALNWTDLADDDRYSGTQTSTLQIAAVTLEMDGTFFRLVASNGSGTEFSAWARLYVSETMHSWRTRMFTPEQLQDAEISGPDATPAHDGLTNLFKYAFDLDPFVPGGGRALPAPFAADGNLVLSFEAIRSDLIYSVETSTNLVNWTTQGVQWFTEGTWREARVPLAGNPAVFLRIVVTTPTAPE